MPRWFYGLLLLVPGALVAPLLDLPPVVVFVTAAGGMVPIAGLIGNATEHLAHHLGPRYGGLLNVTFGNAAELILTLFAVRAGLLTLVKASITGSIIGNTLFALGVSLLVGGLRHGPLCFDARRTSGAAAMMILAIAGLYLPATFATAVQDQPVIEELSLSVAGVLLLTYVAYLVHLALQGRSAAGSSAEDPPPESAVWSVPRASAVLAGGAIGAAICGEVLVGAVEPVTRQLGWSEFFVGVILVALLGNAAEYVSAFRMAWRNRLDVTLAIAAGSSMQVALFVAPVLVFASLGLGHPLTVVFTPLELAILGFAVAIFAYISIDGESSWLEGVQLLGVYAIAALAFFFLRVVAA